jgi:geranylgeranyl diphosphate synthase, type II
MMIKATQLLCETSKGDLRQLLKVFNQTAVEVCEGQQIDMNFEGREDVTEDEYIHMITLKTAVLLGGSLQIGALIAGASNQDAQHLYDFGKFMGVAFQIQDDILDSFGDGAAVGKKIGGDIASNKKTILLIKAMEEDQSGRLKSLLYELDMDAKIQSILSLYQELGVRQYAQSLKQLYLDKAFQSLDKVQIEEQSKNQLRQTALDLMERIS